jgi:TPR repeat protein
MSDLYDGDQSPLRVAHRHLSENDWLYRICLIAAPIALIGAMITGTILVFWSASPPLPPAAVPIQPPKPASPPAAPPSSQAPSQPSPTIDLQALRDHATNDAAALDDLRARAFSGNAEAQFWLATLYDPTMPAVHFSKDATIAADWYEKSAALSYDWAENNLGSIYESGRGRPKDEAQAAIWYRKAADQGNSLAQLNLGGLYEFGRGVSKDLPEAAKWYRKAADAGLAGGEYDLGRFYENGLGGVPQDKTEAARWYEKAADQNNAIAQNELGRLYSAGEGVAVDQDKAFVLIRRSGAAGNPVGIYNLGVLYDNGWGTPRNPLAAYIWYSIAVRLTDTAHQSQAIAGRDKDSRELSRDDLASAQRAADNWQPGAHGRIGVGIQDLTPDQARAIGSTQTKGVIVTKIEDGSPAQQVGLEPQDVITAIDGQTFDNNAAFREALWLGVPGEVVRLWVEKNRQRGRLQDVRVQLVRVTQ